jgi:hypothetical protein
MQQPAPGRTRVLALLAGILIVQLPGLLQAQPGPRGPVAAMFDDDQKRDSALAMSFVAADLPPAGSVTSSLRVYLSAGDLERAFDKREFRPDAAIVPTNTELRATAASPATQRVLVSRIQKQPEIMRDLDEQIAARRKLEPAAPGGLRATSTAAARPSSTPRSAAAPAQSANPRSDRHAIFSFLKRVTRRFTTAFSSKLSPGEHFDSAGRGAAGRIVEPSRYASRTAGCT